MAKVLMAYFSQGKTTKKIVKMVSNGLESMGFTVDIYNIADKMTPDIANYDLIGIGSPVYIFRPPFNVMEYVKGLPGLNGLPFFCFVLHGTLPGNAGNILRDTLSIKGGREIGFAKFKGADFFLGYLQRGFLFSPDNPDDIDLKNAKSWAQEIAGHFSGKKYNNPEKDSMPGIIYSIEKLITKEFFIKYIYSYLFKVDKEKCDSCKVCIVTCPNKNIRFDKNDLPHWGRECLFCLYCQMKCPRDAIKSVVDWPVMAPFMNYNV